MSIELEYFNGEEWVECSTWQSEHLAWISLGGDDFNYRTVDNTTGKILTDKSDGQPTAYR